MYEFCFFNSSIADRDDEDEIFAELLNQCSDTYRPIVERGIAKYAEWKFVYNSESKVEWEIDFSKFEKDDVEAVNIPGVDVCPVAENWFSGKGEIF